ncbi:MAG: phosphatidylglycerophosphatase A [Desulfobulbaceae bacterium]|nr:phosphatidylglycerophosphatase A [Desulfobulbaceae bacterium]
MDRLIMFLATGFGSGYLPKAPGTWGTLVALPIHFLLVRTSPNIYALLMAGLVVFGILIAGSAEKILDQGDPGCVVIDEIAGMLVTLIGAPLNWKTILIGFALFRFFDILKPFPINIADQRFHGGIGIMLDDLIAGLYALIILQILCRFTPLA